MSKGAISRTSVRELAADRGILPDIVYSTREPKPRKAKTGRTPWWMLIEQPGRGSPDPGQPPLKMCKGFSSDLSGQMMRFLEDDPIRWAFEQLREVDPGYAEIWWWHERNGEPLPEIAARLNLKIGTVWNYHSRAWSFIESKRSLFREMRRNERHAAAAG